MIILIIDENTLEIGLEKAYTSFNQSASIFLESQGVNSSYVQYIKIRNSINIYFNCF